jgi:hypothetical protein
MNLGQEDELKAGGMNGNNANNAPNMEKSPNSEKSLSESFDSNADASAGVADGSGGVTKKRKKTATGRRGPASYIVTEANVRGRSVLEVADERVR